MKRVYDFLKEAKVYYLATMDGDQARGVRLVRLTCLMVNYI